LRSPQSRTEMQNAHPSPTRLLIFTSVYRIAMTMFSWSLARRPVVILFDSDERRIKLDEWIRTRLLSRLPATALTLVACRTPPGPAWHADPARQDLLRVVPLRNHSPEEAQEYLRESGVDAERHDHLVDAAHGHPLALSLLAEVVAETQPLIR
jgi:hypothetical protein